MRADVVSLGKVCYGMCQPMATKQHYLCISRQHSVHTPYDLVALWLIRVDATAARPLLSYY